MRFWTACKTIALTLVAVLPAIVSGHGRIVTPQARNTKASTNYNENGLSCGGVGVNYAGGRMWPNGRFTVCGDPPDGPLIHEGGGGFEQKNGGLKITKYKVGQVFSIVIDITAHHGGYFIFKLCPVPKGVVGSAERQHVTQACMDKNVLQRADGRGTKTWLGPKDGAKTYTLQYKFPAGLRCERCVLQWWYGTANSCTYSDQPKEYVVSAGMGICGKVGNPEVFVNCADISLGDTAGPTASVPVPPSKGGGKGQTGANTTGASTTAGGGGTASGGGAGASAVAAGVGGAAAVSSSSVGGGRGLPSLPISPQSLLLGVVAGAAGGVPLLMTGNAALAMVGAFAMCMLAMMLTSRSFFRPAPQKED